ncbi:MAG: fasciclin domain-containing protein [Phormidesmis sp. CAN_BIN44]|nr:fasciclin domain-containing protein [Phormidesmis sp. CAN_BIN44]
MKNSTLVKTLSLAGFLSMGALMSFPTVARSAEMPCSMIKPMTKPTAQVSPMLSSAPMAAEKTIVQIASTNGSFKTLTAALEAAGLTETLSGSGPFTVFAPTDAAFAALPKGTVEKLLLPQNRAMLVKILTYHVVPGKALSTSLKTGNVKTVEGSPVSVKVNAMGVMVNNAKVVTADVKASNGVIHVIDKVIMPSAKTK